MSDYKTICCERCGHVARYSWDYVHQETSSNVGRGSMPSLARRVPTRHFEARRMHMGGGEVDAGISLQEFVTPTRPGQLEADVYVPLLQSWATGIVSLLVTFPIAYHFHWAWYAPMAAGVVGFAAAWFTLLSETRKGLFTVERVEFAPATAVPTPMVNGRLHEVKLQVQEDANHYKYAHLPLPIESLKTIARASVNGRAFTLASWNSILSRKQFESVRGWLLTADYAAWADPEHHQQGIVWTNKGKAFWRALAGER